MVLRRLSEVEQAPVEPKGRALEPPAKNQEAATAPLRATESVLVTADELSKLIRFIEPQVSEIDREFFKTQPRIGFFENLNRKKFNSAPGAPYANAAVLYGATQRLIEDKRRAARLAVAVPPGGLRPENLDRLQGGGVATLPQPAPLERQGGNVFGLDALDPEAAVASTFLDTQVVFEQTQRQPAASMGAFRMEAPRPEEEQASDRQVVLDHLRMLEEEAIRGVTIPGRIAAEVVEVPTYMLEFALTGGAARPVGAAARTAVEGLVEGVLKRNLVSKVAPEAAGKLLTRGAGKLTEMLAETAVRQSLLPHRTAEGFLSRDISNRLRVTDKGLSLINASPEAPATTLMMAMGDTFIELFSEISGDVIAKPFKAAGRVTEAALDEGKLTGKLLNFWRNLEDVYAGSAISRVHPLLTPVGYHGVWKEMGEERSAAFLKATFGIEDFGAEHPERVLDRIVASIPGGDELLVEAGLFTMIGVGGSVAGAVDALREAKLRDGVQDAPAARRMNAAEIERIVSGMRKDQGEGELSPVPLTMDVQGSRRREIAAEKKAPATEKVSPVEADLKEQGITAKTESLTPEQKLFVEGRIRRLDELEADLIAQADELLDRKAEAVANNRITKGLDFKLDRVEKKLDALHAESGELLTSLSPKVKETLDILTSPGRVLGVLRQKVKSARKLTRNEVRGVQEEVIRVIESSLPRSERGGFLRTVKNLQTQEQLATAIPKLVKRLAAIQEEGAQKKALAGLRKMIQSTAPSKVSGRPKGKFASADAQRVFDQIREAASLSPVEAELRIGNLLERAQRQGLTPEEAQSVSILNEFADLGSKTSRELNRLVERLKGVLQTGRLLAEEKLQERREHQAALVEGALRVLHGSQPVPTDAPVKRGVTKRIKEAMTQFLNLSVGWRDIMDEISRFDTGSKPFKSFISTAGNVIPIESKEKGDMSRDTLAFIDSAMRVFGLKTERQMMEQFRKDNELHDLGTFRDAAGRKVKLQLTKAQARKMWAEHLDPSLEETIHSDKGGYLIEGTRIDGLTREMEKAIFESGFLTRQDLDFVAEQMNFYRKFYGRINEVYREDFFIDLPENEFYTPISRSLERAEVVNNFFEEQGYRRSVNPKFTKSRVRNLQKLRLRGDVDVFLSHLAEMNHYVNWSAKMRDLNAMFGHQEVKRLIGVRFGSDTNTVIGWYMEQFTRKGYQRSQLNMNLLDWLRVNFAFAAIVAKPKMFINQASAHVAFLDFVPAKDYVKYTLDFWSHPSKNWSKLNEISDVFRTRSTTSDRDIRDANDSAEMGLFRQNPTWRNALMASFVAGDKFAASGGWAVYKHTLEKTGSEKQAVEAFEEAVTVTQQSSDISQQSQLQAGNSLMKLFTMFLSQPNQYYRLERAAWRNYIAGRLTHAEFAKKLLIYHFGLPMLFQFITDFGFDPEEQLRAAMLGSLNGVFLLNEGIEYASRVILRNAFDLDIPVHEAFDVPVFDLAKNIFNEIGKQSKKEMDFQGFLEAVRDLLVVSSPGVGIPGPQIFNAMQGVEDILEGDGTKGTARILGWPPYVIKRRFGESQKGTPID